MNDLNSDREAFFIGLLSQPTDIEGVVQCSLREILKRPDLYLLPRMDEISREEQIEGGWGCQVKPYMVDFDLSEKIREFEGERLINGWMYKEVSLDSEYTFNFSDEGEKSDDIDIEFFDFVCIFRKRRDLGDLESFSKALKKCYYLYAEDTFEDEYNPMRLSNFEPVAVFQVKQEMLKPSVEKPFEEKSSVESVKYGRMTDGSTITFEKICDTVLGETEAPLYWELLSRESPLMWEGELSNIYYNYFHYDINWPLHIILCKHLRRS